MLAGGATALMVASAVPHGRWASFIYVTAIMIGSLGMQVRHLRELPRFPVSCLPDNQMAASCSTPLASAAIADHSAGDERHCARQPVPNLLVRF